MTDKQNHDSAELATNRLDYLVTALKGIAGAVPFGSLVAEVIGAVIPRQRMDRMLDVVTRVATKLEEVEVNVDQIEDRLRSPEFTDLIEDAMLQASRSLSDERRESIANLLVNGLTGEQLKYQQLKKLISILAELDDPEVITLKHANISSRPAKTEFFTLHENVLLEPAMNMNASENVREKRALQEAWRRRLFQLGLTTNERPGSRDVTALGQMLLSYIEYRGPSTNSVPGAG